MKRQSGLPRLSVFISSLIAMRSCSGGACSRSARGFDLGRSEGFITLSPRQCYDSFGSGVLRLGRGF